MRKPGQVIPKQELLERVWGDEFEGDPNVVEVYVGYLRRKIDRPFGRNDIETIRGLGYRIGSGPVTERHPVTDRPPRWIAPPPEPGHTRPNPARGADLVRPNPRRSDPRHAFPCDASSVRSGSA